MRKNFRPLRREIQQGLQLPRFVVKCNLEIYGEVNAVESYRAEIAAHLPAPRQNWQVFHSVDSTNLVCKRWAPEGAPDGSVAIADHQTAGRGRLGRSFQSEAGLGLYLSILWRPDLSPRQLLPLPALGAVAAARAVESVCGVRPQIKWPNDLVLEGRKIAGILTESVLLGSDAAVVLGIGINVSHRAEDFAGEVRDIAASLEMVTGKTVSRGALAAALMEELDALRQEALAHPAAWLAMYRSCCLTVGREVQVITGTERYRALALGVDEDYGLRVRWENGEETTVRAGEVSVRGLYGYV